MHNVQVVIYCTTAIIAKRFNLKSIYHILFSYVSRHRESTLDDAIICISGKKGSQNSCSLTWGPVLFQQDMTSITIMLILRWPRFDNVYREGCILNHLIPPGIRKSIKPCDPVMVQSDGSGSSAHRSSQVINIPCLNIKEVFTFKCLFSCIL